MVVNDISREDFIEKNERTLSQVRKKQQASDIVEQVSKAIYDKEIATYFVGKEDILADLISLNEKKNEIRELRSKYGDFKTPLVVTISGTPRAGKTTCVDNLTEFLKKADLKVSTLMEPAGLIYSTLHSREEKKELLKDRIGFVEKQLQVGTDAINEATKNSDVIICDRGAIDPYVWYDMYYRMGMMDENRYYDFLNSLKKSDSYYNLFYPLYTTSDIAMARDYINSLSIEPRSTMNKDNVERYNDSLIRMLPFIEQKVDGLKMIDTSSLDRLGASIDVAGDIVNRIRRMY